MQPLVIKKKVAKSNSRTSKSSGLNPFYVCPFCHYQSHIRSRTLQHMTSCKKSHDEKDYQQPAHIRANASIFELKIDKIESEGNNQDRQISCDQPLFENRLDLLEQQVSQIRSAMNESKHSPEIYSLAKEIFQMSSTAIQGVMISKISEALVNSLKSSQDIDKKKFQITSNLIGRFQEMDFSGLINSFSEKLERYYQNIRKDIESKQLTRPVLLEYEKAFKFFSQFQEIDMMLQVRLIQKLLNLGTYRRRFLLKFYSRMINDHPKLFPYDPLPKYLKKNPRSHVKSEPIQFQDVKMLVGQLMQESSELAVDLWMVVSMGLRRYDTSRVYFKIPGTDTFAGFVKLVERKNNHTCIRVIPTSLMKLIALTNIAYPITKQRYLSVQRLAIDRFGRFYGLRSVCLTTIFTAFFKADCLAQTHRTINVPMKHYIDFQSRSLIDSAFALPKLPDIEINTDEGTVLDFQLRGSEPKIQKIRSNKIQFFGMDKDFIVQQLKDIEQEENIISTEPSNFDADNALEKQSFEVLLSSIRKKVFLEYGETTTKHVFLNITSALSFLTQGSWKSEKEQQMESDNQSKIQYVCQVFCLDFNCQVKLIEAFYDRQDIRLKQVTIGKADQEVVLIKFQQKQFGTYFLPCESNLDLKKAVKEKNTLGESTSYNLSLTLGLSKPSCPKCKKGNLSSTLCQRFHHLASVCLLCRFQAHNCVNNEAFQLSVLKKQSIKIIPVKKQQVQKNIQPLMVKSQKNNIREVVESSGYNYQQDTIYCSGTPSYFSCQYLPMSLEVSHVILQNRINEEFLPLEVKESSILNSGLGVYCTDVIPKNTIICSYLGEVGTGSKITLMRNGRRNDSLYLLGHLGLESLNIAPHRYSNVGRFLNHQEKKLCNCSPHIGLLQYKKGQYEVGVYLLSTRKINKGEELYYFYGKDYDFEGQSEEERENEQELEQEE